MEIQLNKYIVIYFMHMLVILYNLINISIQ